MTRRSADFESAASASSAIPAWDVCAVRIVVPKVASVCQGTGCDDWPHSSDAGAWCSFSSIAQTQSFPNLPAAASVAGHGAGQGCRAGCGSMVP